MAKSKQFPKAESLIAPSTDRIFEQIINYFKEQMAANTLKPGDRLLSERELAERLGVSRASLREALRTLEVLGLLEIRPKLGAFIRSPDPHALATFFGITLSLQPKTSEEILEARMAIECQAIRLACQRATPEDLTDIKQALEQIPRQVADPALGATTDFNFHSAIVHASHSAILLLVYESLEALLMQSHHERRAAIFGVAEFLETLGQAHTALYDAILARDEQMAEDKMRQHFSLVQQYYKELQTRELNAPTSRPSSSNKPDQALAK